MEQAPSARSFPNRVNILGVGVHATNPGEAADLLFECVKQKRKGYVCFRDVHGIMQAHGDPELRRIHNRSLLTVPDGMPTVWWGKAKGYSTIRRIYGPDFMLKVLEASQQDGSTHFFYGGGEGVAETMRERLQSRFPNAKIIGTCTPPFRLLSEQEETELTEQIATLKPDFFWVGLSTPKQERFMAAHGHLDTTIMLGVGAAFDIHAGSVEDAPEWLKETGLQWVSRICREPRRLACRYLYHVPRFLWHALWQWTGLRRYTMED